LDTSRLSQFELVFLQDLRMWLGKLQEVEWSIEPFRSRRGYTVELKPRLPGSVPVVACAERGQVVIFIEDIEHVFGAGHEPLDETSGKAISFLEAAISGKVKIVVTTSSGKPYKRTSYVCQKGGWHELCSNYDRLFFNWFGRRTTREYVINCPQSGQ